MPAKLNDETSCFLTRLAPQLVEHARRGDRIDTQPRTGTLEIVEHDRRGAGRVELDFEQPREIPRSRRDDRVLDPGQARTSRLEDGRDRLFRNSSLCTKCPHGAHISSFPRPYSAI